MEVLIYTILWVKDDSERPDSLLKRLKGISGEGLYPIAFNNITAVVSDIDKRSIVADSSSALVFARLIEDLWKQFTLLPMRFGSVVESADAVRKMLERNVYGIQTNLQSVENKLEFGLKVFCDPEKLKAELIEKSRIDVSHTFNPVNETNVSVFRDYVNKKLEAHRLEELLLSHVDSVIANFTGHCDRLNVVCKTRKMLSETTIIDAVFLLEKSRKEPLIHYLEELKTQYPGLNFVLTGPWPPYSFVESTIK
jgi:hypothetical protein